MKTKLYGTGWCTKTAFLKNYLQSEWIPFEYVNVEENEAEADYIKSLFGGKLKFPVLLINDIVLLNPGISELRKHLNAL